MAAPMQEWNALRWDHRAVLKQCDAWCLFATGQSVVVWVCGSVHLSMTPHVAQLPPEKVVRPKEEPWSKRKRADRVALKVSLR